MKKVGWGLIIIGALVQASQAANQANAAVNNVSASDTNTGWLAQANSYLPFPLGWSMMGVGAGLVWVVPLVS